MTVLIAHNTKDKIILGADTCVFYGNSGFKQDLSSSNQQLKIFEVNGMIFSSTGNYSEQVNFGLFCQTRRPECSTQLGIQRFFVEFGKWLREQSLGEVYNNYFLVFDNKLFHFSFKSVQEVKEGHFAVDGAGFREAYMAMYLKNTVKRSIELVMEMNSWTGGNAQIVEVKK